MSSKYLKRVLLVIFLLIANKVTYGQVMLGATFPELKNIYQRSSDYFGWEEKFADDGTPMVTYRDSQQPHLLICCYFDGGVVKKFGWIGPYDEFCKSFFNYCNTNLVRKYPSDGIEYLDKVNSCIWSLKAATTNPIRSKWTVMMFAEPIE